MRAALSLVLLGILASALGVGTSGATETLVEAPLKAVVLPDVQGEIKLRLTTLAVPTGGIEAGNVPIYAVVEGKFDRAKIESYVKPSGKFEAGDKEGLTTFTATSTSGTATAGTDFMPLDASVRLLPGARKNIRIPFLDDDEPEPTEVFFLTISARGKKGRVTKQVTVIVLDDDTAPTEAPGPLGG